MSSERCLMFFRFLRTEQNAIYSVIRPIMEKEKKYHVEKKETSKTCFFAPKLFVDSCTENLVYICTCVSWKFEKHAFINNPSLTGMNIKWFFNKSKG